MIKVEKESRSLSFPKLMVDQFYDTIVLMTDISSDKGTGICLDEGNSEYTLAEIRNDWDLKCFVDYVGTVTILNTEE